MAKQSREPLWLPGFFLIFRSVFTSSGHKKDQATYVAWSMYYLTLHNNL
jgi:hypothetical protein